MSTTPIASPTVHVNHWTESQVSDWLGTIGLSKFSKDFKSNGITGDVLVLLDDDALRDIGVSTIGQRLALLSAIYRLKQQFAIPIQEGDYIPKSLEAHEAAPATATSPHMVSLLRQRDDRIRVLEGQIFKLADYLSRFQQDFASVCKHIGVKTLTSEMPISVTASSSRASELGGHSHTSSESSAHSLSNFGSQSDLSSVAGSNYGVDSPTSRHFSGIVSPSRSSYASSLGFASSGYKSSAGPAYGQSGSWQHHSEENGANGSVGVSSGFKPATTPSQRGEGYGLSGSHGAAGPNTPTAGGGMAASASLPSLSSGSADLSPTQTTPSATPTAASSGQGHSSAPLQSPTRRYAQPSSSSTLTRSRSNAALGQTRNVSPSHGSTSSAAAGAAAAAGPTSASTSTADGASKADRSITPAPAGTLASGSGSSADNSARSSVGSDVNSARSSVGSDVNSARSSVGSDVNPYRSFRVTLDDPCHKVLPAALKKYKIVDDWKLYALFICYGSTERCLSYDEKPLLLFQKLKENQQNPVFMLRHIRDIRSPVAIANAKAEAVKNNSSASAATKSLGSVRSDKRRIIAGSPPPGAFIAHQSAPVEMGPAAEVVASNKATRTHAVAIYPYQPERNDEIDVKFGDVFVVRNKSKGWWIVQRDSTGTGTGDVVYSVPSSEPSDNKVGAAYQAEIWCGWVPAGCLLETSKPLAEIVTSAGRGRAGSLVGSGPNTPTVATAAAAAASAEQGPMSTTPRGDESSGTPSARASIPPMFITSTSSPGIMLMDYKAEDGFELKKDNRLRVFKKYNHWSYCVQEGEPHARGWIPTWYIGKLSSSSGTSSAGHSSGTSSAGHGSGGMISRPASGTSRDAKASAATNGKGTTLSPTTLLDPSTSTAVSPGGDASRSAGAASGSNGHGIAGDGASPSRARNGEPTSPSAVPAKIDGTGEET